MSPGKGGPACDMTMVVEGDAFGAVAEVVRATHRVRARPCVHRGLPRG